MRSRTSGARHARRPRATWYPTTMPASSRLAKERRAACYEMPSRSQAVATSRTGWLTRRVARPASGVPARPAAKGRFVSNGTWATTICVKGVRTVHSVKARRSVSALSSRVCRGKKGEGDEDRVHGGGIGAADPHRPVAQRAGDRRVGAFPGVRWTVRKASRVSGTSRAVAACMARVLVTTTVALPPVPPKGSSSMTVRAEEVSRSMREDAEDSERSSRLDQGIRAARTGRRPGLPPQDEPVQTGGRLRWWTVGRRRRPGDHPGRPRHQRRPRRGTGCLVVSALVV